MEYSKIAKQLIIFIFAVSFSALTTTVIYAKKQDSILLIDIEAEDAQERMQHAAIRKSSLEVLQKDRFYRILVSNNWIAVGNKNNVVGVFDIKGDLLYCIRFTTTGDYYFFYNDTTDSLVIQIVRNNTYYVMDNEGSIIKMIDSQNKNVKNFKESLMTDTFDNEYYIKSHRDQSSLFLKKCSRVMKKGRSEAVFLESEYYLSEDLPFIILMAVAAAFTFLFHDKYAFEWLKKRGKE